MSWLTHGDLLFQFVCNLLGFLAAFPFAAFFARFRTCRWRRIFRILKHAMIDYRTSLYGMLILGCNWTLELFTNVDGWLYLARNKNYIPQSSLTSCANKYCPTSHKELPIHCLFQTLFSELVASKVRNSDLMSFSALSCPLYSAFQVPGTMDYR